MKLTGPEILKRIEAGEIVIDPFCPDQMNPNSYNLRLDRKLLVYDCRPVVQRHEGGGTLAPLADHIIDNWRYDRYLSAVNGGQCVRPGVKPKAGYNIELADWGHVLDMKAQNPTYELEIPETGLVLIPGRLYLGHTVEYTETHTTVPCIEGRSSIGRLGITVHASAGFGDIGFCGTWTLEISVIEPVRIYPDVCFCQINYETVIGEVVKYKSEKYQGQSTPRASGLWKEFQA